MRQRMSECIGGEMPFGRYTYHGPLEGRVLEQLGPQQESQAIQTDAFGSLQFQMEMAFFAIGNSSLESSGRFPRWKIGSLR